MSSSQTTPTAKDDEGNAAAADGDQSVLGNDDGRQGLEWMSLNASHAFDFSTPEWRGGPGQDDDGLLLLTPTNPSSTPFLPLLSPYSRGYSKVPLASKDYLRRSTLSKRGKAGGNNKTDTPTKRNNLDLTEFHTPTSTRDEDEEEEEDEEDKEKREAMKVELTRAESERAELQAVVNQLREEAKKAAAKEEALLNLIKAEKEESDKSRGASAEREAALQKEIERTKESQALMLQTLDDLKTSAAKTEAALRESLGRMEAEKAALVDAFKGLQGQHEGLKRNGAVAEAKWRLERDALSKWKSATRKLPHYLDDAEKLRSDIKALQTDKRSLVHENQMLKDRLKGKEGGANNMSRASMISFK